MAGIATIFTAIVGFFLPYLWREEPDVVMPLIGILALPVAVLLSAFMICRTIYIANGIEFSGSIFFGKMWRSSMAFIAAIARYVVFPMVRMIYLLFVELKRNIIHKKD